MAQEITKMETIQAVDRAFSLLELIARRNSISLIELAQETKINKASLSRLIFTLTENGYIQKNSKNGEYSLTLKAYEVGINAVQNLDKISLINSTLVELNRQTGRIAQFSVEEDNQLLCLQSIGQRQNFFSVYSNVGQRSPLYCTSAGKALLSTYPNTTIMEKWDSLDVKSLTTNTITDLQDFLQEMGNIRQRGYSLDMEENEYSTFCIGIPVFDHTNKPIGALSITGNSMTPEEEQSLSELLISHAKRLSELLGYIGK